MEAETMAIWNYGFSNIQLETDSLSLKLINMESVMGDIAEKIEEIKEMMNRLNVQIQHTFREAYQLADHITKIQLSVK